MNVEAYCQVPFTEIPCMTSNDLPLAMFIALKKKPKRLETED
nr:MAG TPA: hypothetical protein [Caudoviricetes sp.]